MKIVAVVPVKTVSERVESKNFKDFYRGSSLFDIKINQLLSSTSIQQVFVSSDIVELPTFSGNQSRVQLIDRPNEFCNNVTPWSDVIYEVVGSLPVDDDDIVVWAHVTCPFFARFDEAIEAYFRASDQGYDGIVGVERMAEFFINHAKRPVNYSWGGWHPYSQELDPLYRVTGAVFIAKKSMFLKMRYVVSRQPQFFETTSIEGLDIDTPSQFELASYLFANYGNMNWI